MVKEVQLSDETYSYLEQVRLQLEAKQGRKLSFDEVIKSLGQEKGNEADSMEIIWERLGEIQDTLSEIKEMLSATKEGARGRALEPQVEHEEKDFGEIEGGEGIEEAEEQEETPKAPRPRISIPTSPIRGSSRGSYRQQPQGAQSSAGLSDSFLNFIKSVGAYPLSRIRKPISQIRDLEEKGVVKIIGEDEDRVLVYRPYYDAIIASLPRTENEIEELSPAQKKVLDEMHKATLVYKDQNGVWRLTTPSA